MKRAAPAPHGHVLIDTGVLVALYAHDDPQHAACADWLAGCHAKLHTVDAVLVEAAWFVPPRVRPALAQLVASGVIAVHHPDRAAYTRIGELLAKYADRDPDWADIELVWLAEAQAIDRIATLDVADFSVYRIQGRKRFRLELLG